MIGRELKVHPKTWIEGGRLEKEELKGTKEGMKAKDWGNVEETWWETINTAHQDAAGSD